MFERKHALAPLASLRFKLLPRLPDTQMEGITVRVVGEQFSMPVDVAADQTFALMREPRALAEDASVIPNRKAHTLTWRADIRTPGLPPNTRRLGDLRLECWVGMEAGLVSEGPPVVAQIAALAEALSSICTSSPSGYLYFADRPVFSVTLSAGPRRETVRIDDMYAGLVGKPGELGMRRYYDYQALIERTYQLPLGDMSWPDDTLVSFEDME